MAAVRLWGTVLTGMMSSSKSMSGSAGSDANEIFSTEFVMHQISYFFMVWSSLTFGGIMLIEQYFGRRIFCFQPTNFSQPAAAIGEYCWEHGRFESDKQYTEFYFENHDWILNSFVYYFIRATIFIIPHLVWQYNFEPKMVAVIKGTVALVKELQGLWLRLSEVADQAYSDLPVEETVVNNNTRESINPQTAQAKLLQTYKAVYAMTRDVVHITKQQIPQYTSINYFIQARLIYDVLVLLVYSLLDLYMFHLANKFDSTDYYCKLPNSEDIRCMVPMMSFQWYVSFLAVASCILMFIINIIYTCTTLCSLCFGSTKGTFLENIPFASDIADTNWHSCTDCKTYKIISKLMMQNLCVLHPLNFLKSFVCHLENNHRVGEDLLSVKQRPQRMMAFHTAGPNDVDDQLWRRLLKV